MADKKISALPAATTPLTGAEVIPVVQGGVTDQVSVANLTSGRDVAVKKLNPTDNVVMAAGKGIDFSANGGDVLKQYDEGTWTPNFSAWTNAPTFSDARYIRIGSQVTVCILGQNGVNAGGQAISGLPFTSSNAVAASGVFKSLNSSATFGFGAVDTGSTSITAINAITFSSYWAFTVTYFVTF